MKILFFIEKLRRFLDLVLKLMTNKKKKLFGIATWTPHDWNDIKQQSSIHRKFSCERKFCDAGPYARPYSSSLVIKVEKFVQLKNI